MNDRYFANNSAAGLEPYVTIKHEKIHWIKGMVRYLVAAFQAIMEKPEWGGRVTWDGRGFEREVFPHHPGEWTTYRRLLHDASCGSL